MTSLIQNKLHSRSGHEFDYFSLTQFVFLHLGCLLVLWVGASQVAVGLCLFFYLVRIFAMSAGYHRYFAHRSYKTSRLFQFVLAFLGSLSYQKGPLWWAAHHRHHHLHADRAQDIHSPRQDGFWWAHCGWIFSLDYRKANKRLVSNLMQYRELRLLDKYYPVPPLVVAALMFASGVVLGRLSPSLHTSGLQMLTWGFFVSTVLVHHAIYSVNSFGHMMGSRRFDSEDTSHNNLIIALLTFGDGWHNNHHYYQHSARHGFYKWEVDLSHLILKALSRLGIVWDLQSPPRRVYASAYREVRVSDVVTVVVSDKLPVAK